MGELVLHSFITYLILDLVAVSNPVPQSTSIKADCLSSDTDLGGVEEGGPGVSMDY